MVSTRKRRISQSESSDEDNRKKQKIEESSESEFEESELEESELEESELEESEFEEEIEIEGISEEGEELDHRLYIVENGLVDMQNTDLLNTEKIKNMDKETFESRMAHFEEIQKMNKIPTLVDILESDISNENKSDLIDKMQIYDNTDISEDKLHYKKQIIRLFKRYANKDQSISEEEQNIRQKLEDEDIGENIMKLNTSDKNKRVIYKKYIDYENASKETSEYADTLSWLTKILSFPFGKYSDTGKKTLLEVKQIIDSKVMYMDTVKEEIIHIAAAQMRKRENIRPIAIQGVPGIGKTRIVSSIAEALGRPYYKISLGGARDGCLLRGSAGVWKSSSYGKIVDAMMSTGVLDPVIHFDELDKLSHESNEIFGVLTHLIDSSQNQSFSDDFFQGIDFDVSKILFVFTYNESRLVNSIVSDRMHKYLIDPPTFSQKVEICERHLIPEILYSYGFEKEQIIFDKEIVKSIVSKTQATSSEKGCRDLKRNIETIVMRINTVSCTTPDEMQKLNLDYKYPKKLNLPIVVTKEITDDFFPKNKKEHLSYFC